MSRSDEVVIEELPRTDKTATTIHDEDGDQKLQQDTMIEQSDLVGVQKFANHEEANQAEEFERNISNRDAFKYYKKAVFWAWIASWSIIMEGYDTSVTGTYNALPVFREYFGTYYPDIDQWQIPAKWQSAQGAAGSLGNFVGIPLGGYLIERFGYRKALMGNYVLILPLIAISAFAQNLPMLFAGSLLQGVPFGVFSTLACGYASEVCPVKLRGYLTGWIDTCWVLGILFGTGIANVIVEIKTIWGFRAGYMTQWAWPIQLFIFMWIAPEAPWWLIRKGRVDEAEKALRRLTSPQIHDRVPGLINNMVRTHQLELAFVKKHKWTDMFLGVDRRRTEISCMSFANQLLAGAPFAASPIYFFEQAGLSTSEAFKLGLANPAFLFISNVAGYLAMSRIGRRTLYNYGMFGCFLLLLCIGGVQKAAFKDVNAKWAIAALVFIWNIVHGACMGPQTYALVAEAPSVRLRNVTIAAARFFYVMCQFICSFFQPWLINPSALNLKGYAAFVWAPICFLGWVWIYFRLPEFKDRSYYELDVLFEKRIPARKFRETKVDLSADEQMGVSMTTGVTA